MDAEYTNYAFTTIQTDYVLVVIWTNSLWNKTRIWLTKEMPYSIGDGPFYMNSVEYQPSVIKSQPGGQWVTRAHKGEKEETFRILDRMF